MGAKTAKLRRNQLDRFFQGKLQVFSLNAPKDGWVKEIRQALGMSMADLGARLNVIKQRVERIEKDEVAGKVTVQTLRETAEALNCELVYFFVPKGEGLQATLEKQARLAAQEVVQKTEHTMHLEKQDTSRASQEELIREITQELLAKEDKKIWKLTSENRKSTKRHSP